MLERLRKLLVAFDEPPQFGVREIGELLLDRRPTMLARPFIIAALLLIIVRELTNLLQGLPARR